MRAALFSYVRERGAPCRRVGGRPDDPGSDPIIIARLVPEQWRLRGYRGGGRPRCPQMGSRELLALVRTGYSGRQGGVLFPHTPQCWSRCHGAWRAPVRAGAAAILLIVAGMASHRPSAFT
jgi:hypothetical protein